MQRPCVSLIAGALMMATGAAANDVEHDAKEQCSTLKRLFAYDKLLRESEKIVLLVVNDSETEAETVALATACRELDLFSTTVPSDGLTDVLTEMLGPESAVLYVREDADHDSVSEFAIRKGFLTVSDELALAHSGDVSVSLQTGGGRREIVVNLTRLEQERHELSAELLRLAKIVR